jgi:hypothetical protein
MKPSRPKPSSETQQLGLALDSVKLGGLSPAERQRALRLLATLLIEAAGLAAEGRVRDRG